jgi:hypothetical protein
MTRPFGARDISSQADERTKGVLLETRDNVSNPAANPALEHAFHGV